MLSEKYLSYQLKTWFMDWFGDPQEAYCFCTLGQMSRLLRLQQKKCCLPTVLPLCLPSPLLTFSYPPHFIFSSLLPNTLRQLQIVWVLAGGGLGCSAYECFHPLVFLTYGRVSPAWHCTTLAKINVKNPLLFYMYNVKKRCFKHDFSCFTLICRYCWVALNQFKLVNGFKQFELRYSRKIIVTEVIITKAFTINMKHM